MRENKLNAQIGYKRRYIKGGKVGRVAANILARNFDPKEPNQAWVSDITYARTREVFLLCCNGTGFIFSAYRRLVNGSKYWSRLSHSCTVDGCYAKTTQIIGVGS